MLKRLREWLTGPSRGDRLEGLVFRLADTNAQLACDLHEARQEIARLNARKGDVPPGGNVECSDATIPFGEAMAQGLSCNLDVQEAVSAMEPFVAFLNREEALCREMGCIPESDNRSMVYDVLEPTSYRENYPTYGNLRRVRTALEKLRAWGEKTPTAAFVEPLRYEWSADGYQAQKAAEEYTGGLRACSEGGEGEETP